MNVGPSASCSVATLAATVAFVVLALPAAGGTGSSGPTWTPARGLPFPNARVDGPAVAVNAAGDAVLTWGVRTPEPCTVPACTYTLMAASRQRGQDSWSTPVALGASALSIYAPVALDARGDATAVFLEIPHEFPQGAAYRVRASALHDGHWDRPVTLANERSLGSPQVVVNDEGDAVAYWANNSNLLTSHWEAAYRSGPFGTWEQPAVVAAGAGSDVGVGLDGAGNVLAVSSLPTNNGTFIQSVTRSSVAKTWNEPTTVAGPSPAGSLQLAVNARGAAVAMWATSDDQGGFIQSISRAAGGRWTAPQPLSRHGGGVHYASLVIDRTGNALAAWTEEPVQFTPSTWTAYRHASTGRWESEVQLDPTGQIPYLAVEALSGNIIALWQETPWTGREMRTSLRPATLGAWTSVDVLGKAQLGAFGVGVDARGHALAAWSDRSDAGIETLETSELAANGPVLANPRIPKKSRIGVPVPFRITPARWGSPLKGAPLWRFGDGARASGASISHVYRRAGVFEVSVAQADRAGGRSTMSGRVTVRRARS
jgi:hypothetical protein